MRARLKKSSEGPDSKQRFIDATRELMIEAKSIEPTFLQIAARTGLNSALIKYHFGDKNGLLTAVALNATLRHTDALLALVDSDIPALKKMEIHLLGIINLYWEHPYINDLVDYLTRSAEERYVRQIDAQISEPFARSQMAIIRQGVASGDFKDVDPELTFYILRGGCRALVEASSGLSKIFQNGIMVREDRIKYSRAIVNLLLTGLSK